MRRWAMVPLAGLGVGAATSFGQTLLGGGILDPLVNSASAWLVAPTLMGLLMTSISEAAVAGLAVCFLQLVGYYATAHLRGYAAGGSILVFWTACSAVGGPLFGAAGRICRDAGSRWRGPAAAALPSAFLAEGIWVYAHELHAIGETVLWLAIGLALAAILPRGIAEKRWLPATFSAALLGEIVLTTIYSQAF